jgi:hypothetical protein
LQAQTTFKKRFHQTVRGHWLVLWWTSINCDYIYCVWWIQCMRNELWIDALIRKTNGLIGREVVGTGYDLTVKR